MDYNAVVKEIELKYPEIKRSFGDIDTFLNNVYTSYPNNIKKYISILLNRNFYLKIISPLNIRFPIYDLYDSVEIEGLIFEEPYSIHDLEGNLLYQVSDHNGIFGNSILDKLLLVDFQSGAFFYLHYKTYKEDKFIVLINSYLTTNTIRDIKLTSTQPTTLLQTEQLNNIKFKLISGIRDMTKPGLPYYPITIHYLPSSSSVILQRQTIISSSLTSKEVYDPQLNPEIVLNITKSGWITITQEGNSSIPLTINNIIGDGVERFFEVLPCVYYVVADADTKVNLIRQAFNMDTVNNFTFSNYTQLDLKADLSI